MLFGILSLLMGHWTVWVSKICIKSSGLITSLHSFDHSALIKQKKLIETHSLDLENLNLSVMEGLDALLAKKCSPKKIEPELSLIAQPQLSPTANWFTSKSTKKI